MSYQILPLTDTFKSSTQGLRYRQTRFSRRRYVCGFVLEVEEEEPRFFFVLFVDVDDSSLSCNQCCQMAKFDPFLYLDCAGLEGRGRVRAQSNPEWSNPNNVRIWLWPSGNHACNSVVSSEDVASPPLQLEAAAAVAVERKGNLPRQHF